MKINHLTPVFILLAVSSALLGLSMLLLGETRHITLVTDFFSVTQYASAAVFNTLAALSFVAIAVLSVLALKNERYSQPLAWLLIVVGIVPLIALFSSKMWIGSLGGFPAIGAGQGVIKYFALVSVGVLLLKPSISIIQQRLIAAFPVIVVLLWIGGMKFTQIEAKGIEDLVATSPFMFWMYKIWDVQTTSNLIGVYDLIAAALVLGSVFKPKLFLPAALMSGAVFVVTQTFLFSVAGAVSSQTILSATGHFLIKDLWFIANLVWLWKLTDNGFGCK